MLSDPDYLSPGGRAVSNLFLRFVLKQNSYHLESYFEDMLPVLFDNLQTIAYYFNNDWINKKIFRKSDKSPG